MSDAKRFDGRVAAITGAAGGFGLTVATRLAAEGAQVVLVDRDAGALERAAGAIPGAGAIVADVSAEDDVRRYMAQVFDAHGRLDLFFNNAGIEGPRCPMTEVATADFDKVIAVNVRGVFLGLREALRIMIEQGSGAIVNSASMAALHGSAMLTAYAVSKHAVVGLSQSAALEGGRHGVRVNAIAPGHIDTRMARDLAAQVNPADPQAAIRMFSNQIPLGRYGTAEEVSNLVCWLLSDESSYVSGGLFVIDGGRNA
jgi:3alpha(or 20beta)-hydroxysteroid dehydrogenase